MVDSSSLTRRSAGEAVVESDGERSARAESRFPQRIVVCLSRSPRAAAIAAEAWHFAQSAGASCVFLHTGRIEADTATDLRDAMHAAGIPHDVELVMRQGSPHVMAHRFARERGADMIIAGVLQRSTSLAQHMQSVAGRLAVSAPCSVLLLAHPQLQPQPYRCALAVADFDALTRRMFDRLAAMPSLAGVRSWNMVTERQGLAWPMGIRLSRTRNEQMRRGLEEFASSLPLQNIRVHMADIERGDGCEFLWYANAARADIACVPLSDRRLRFWERLLRFEIEIDVNELPRALLLYREPLDEDID